MKIIRDGKPERGAFSTLLSGFLAGEDIGFGVRYRTHKLGDDVIEEFPEGAKLLQMVNTIECNLHPSVQSLPCPAKPSRRVQLILSAFFLLSPTNSTLIIGKGMGERASWCNKVVMGINYTTSFFTVRSYFYRHPTKSWDCGLVRPLEFLARYPPLNES